jgi:hypothetical protein
VLLAVLIALRQGSSTAWVATIGAGLLVGVVVLRWRGRELGRGVYPGIAAGIAPLILPSLTVECVGACTSACTPHFGMWCQVSCIAGGLAAGAFVGLRAAHVGPGWLRFLLSGIAVAAATGAMGCLLGGGFGVAGMLVGFGVGAVPVVMMWPRAA